MQYWGWKHAGRLSICSYRMHKLQRIGRWERSTAEEEEGSDIQAVVVGGGEWFRY